MDDYILGTASAEANAILDSLQQQASQLQTQIFNASDSSARMLFFAFDGTGNNKDDPSLGPATNVAHIYGSADQALRSSNSGQAFYFKGPGTEDNLALQLLDGATGITVPETVGETAFYRVSLLPP